MLSSSVFTFIYHSKWHSTCWKLFCCHISGLGSWIPSSRCDQYPLLDRGASAWPPTVAGQGAHSNGFPTQPHLFSIITRASSCLHTGSHRLFHWVFCPTLCLVSFQALNVSFIFSMKNYCFHWDKWSAQDKKMGYIWRYLLYIIVVCVAFPCPHQWLTECTSWFLYDHLKLLILF